MICLLKNGIRPGDFHSHVRRYPRSPKADGSDKRTVKVPANWRGGIVEWEHVPRDLNGLVQWKIFTGNHGFSHQVWGFPADFPLNQSNKYQNI